MVTNVELYEALKRKVGEDAARMISEVVPPATELATKSDMAGVRLEVANLRTEMAAGFGELRAEIRAAETRVTRWMLTFFVPLWVGVWAMVLALALKP